MTMDTAGRIVNLHVTFTAGTTGLVIGLPKPQIDAEGTRTDGDTVWFYYYDAMDLRVLVKSEDLAHIDHKVR